MNPHAGSNIRNLEMNRESFAENVEAKIIIG
jgi:DNA-binding TFAR19-related protein (PDSD5 family)